MIGGGRGGAVGTVFGALTLTIIVNIFLVLGVRTYLRADRRRRGADPRGARLRRRPRPADLRFATPPARQRTTTAPTLAAQRRSSSAPRRPRRGRQCRAGSSRNAPTLRYILPAYVLLAAADARHGGHQRQSASPSSAISSRCSCSRTFLAVLGLGQGAVIIAGGLDLSVAWTITFPAIVVTTYRQRLGCGRRSGRSRSRSASAR